MLKPVGEDFVKRYRLEYNLEALKRVRRDIGEIAHTRLRALIEYRLSGKDFDRSPTGAKVAVAFSGGSDSTATLKVLRWAGFDAIPITVKLPRWEKRPSKKPGTMGLFSSKFRNIWISYGPRLKRCPDLRQMSRSCNECS